VPANNAETTKQEVFDLVRNVITVDSQTRMGPRASYPRILHKNQRDPELDAEADDRRALERERDDTARRQDRDELPARTSNRDAPGASEQQRENDDPEPDPDEPDQPELDR
jgi:hypothetical protein